ERLRKRLGLEEATKNKGFDLGNGGKTQNVSVPTVEGVARGTSYGWVDGGLRGTNLGAGVIDPTNVHSDNLLHVWSMPSTANVSQQEAPRPLEKVNLLAARNERESFQIALRPKVSWATSGIAGSVLIQCTDLCSSSGDRYENSSLPEDRIGELVKETLAAVGLKVVPTEYKYLSKKILPTNQGSVTEYFLSIRPTERAWPAVYFLYDLSPITFTIKEERRNFLHFITRLCAVLGGTFAMTGPHLSREKDNEEEESDRDGFFRRLLRDSKEEDMELTPSSDGLLKRLFRDKEDRQGEDDEKDFFRRDSNHARHGNEERLGKSVEDDDREGFFRKIFKDKNEERKDEGHQKPDEREKVGFSRIRMKKRKGLFMTGMKMTSVRKVIKKTSSANYLRINLRRGELRDLIKMMIMVREFLSFRRLFRVHPEDPKSGHIESSQSNNLSEGSLGSESFFKRLFRDRDRSLEDSEIFGSKMAKEARIWSHKHPGTTGINEKQSGKPPLPINAVAELRKGSYYASLELVQALCDTSYGLVDIFPIEDRKIALRESLIEINSQIASAEKNGDDFCLCFPMGKGIYRVVHIPEDESVLLNSREKAPYLICVEVLKAEAPSHSKGSSDGHKLSKDGIPLANGDVQLPKPPPWAYPLWSRHETQNYETDIMLKSTSQVIDQAMAQLWETKVKFVNVSFSIEKLGRAKSIVLSETGRRLRHDATDSNMIVMRVLFTSCFLLLFFLTRSNLEPLELILQSPSVLRTCLARLFEWLLLWLFVKLCQTTLKNGFSSRAIKEPGSFYYWEPKHQKTGPCHNKHAWTSPIKDLFVSAYRLYNPYYYLYKKNSIRCNFMNITMGSGSLLRIFCRNNNILCRVILKNIFGLGGHNNLSQNHIMHKITVTMNSDGEKVTIDIIDELACRAHLENGVACYLAGGFIWSVLCFERDG
ncbi:hypothetical protein ACJX0J_035446, partial [Zea mays]